MLLLTILFFRYDIFATSAPESCKDGMKPVSPCCCARNISFAFLRYNRNDSYWICGGFRKEMEYFIIINMDAITQTKRRETTKHSLTFKSLYSLSYFHASTLFLRSCNSITFSFSIFQFVIASSFSFKHASYQCLHCAAKSASAPELFNFSFSANSNSYDSFHCDSCSAISARIAVSRG